MMHVHECIVATTINRFQENTCVAIVSHGLTLRAFAMRWLHWTVRQFLEVGGLRRACRRVGFREQQGNLHARGTV